MDSRYLRFIPIGPPMQLHELTTPPFVEEAKVIFQRHDRDLRDQFEKSLAGLKRYYRLGNWYDREILAGQEWEKAIAEQLRALTSSSCPSAAILWLPTIAMALRCNML